jgi:hypothetical protein
MSWQPYVAVAGSAAVFAGGFTGLAVLLRAQVRRYNRRIATEVLDDWAAQLELLTPAERERARLDPPPAVVTAMLALPAPGRRGDWDERSAPTVTG